jgi:hypothetical protein
VLGVVLDIVGGSLCCFGVCFVLLVLCPPPHGAVLVFQGEYHAWLAWVVSHEQLPAGGVVCEAPCGCGIVHVVSSVVLTGGADLWDG